jgi:hypothetical protein
MSLSTTSSRLVRNEVSRDSGARQHKRRSNGMSRWHTTSGVADTVDDSRERDVANKGGEIAAGNCSSCKIVRGRGKATSISGTEKFKVSVVHGRVEREREVKEEQRLRTAFQTRVVTSAGSMWLLFA